MNDSPDVRILELHFEEAHAFIESARTAGVLIAELSREVVLLVVFVVRRVCRCARCRVVS